MEEKVRNSLERNTVKRRSRKKSGRKKQRSRAKERNKHHIIPVSRLKNVSKEEYRDEKNLVEYPINFHDALHTVFGNLITSNGEGSTFLKKISEPGIKWNNRKLEKLRTKIKKGEVFSH